MLQTESVVDVIDNTGAKRALIIGIPQWTRKKSAGIGEIVVVVVKSASSTWVVKKWQVMRAMIVRTRKEIWRNDWTYIRFENNAVILLDINDKWEMKPKWKRIFWPVAKEVRQLGYKEVTNIAEEVI